MAAIGLHKPDDQTSLPAAEAVAFLAPLPVRCLRGVGAAAEASLAALGVGTVAELAAQPRAALARALGDRMAPALFEAARGRDASPVVAKAAPRAVSVEDSFRGVSSRQGAEDVLRVLAPDLVARCAEERARDGRRPRTLTLRWRLAPAAAKGGAAQRGSQRASASGMRSKQVFVHSNSKRALFATIQLRLTSSTRIAQRRCRRRCRRAAPGA